MSTITRKEFVKDLSKAGINVNDMSSETRAKLNKAGVSDAEIKKIAGKDGQIKGEAELNQLFKVVDKFDSNGSGNSFVNKDSSGNITTSGEVYEALKSEVDKNRAKASQQGVIHLGMRDSSSKEADALEKGNPKANGGVVRIEAYKANGEVSYEGKTFDLKTKAGLNSYRDALTAGPDKMPKAQAQKFVDFLGTQKKESRDELAQLGLNFHRTGEGKLPVNRLVLSGHGWDGAISGDDGGKFTLGDIKNLAGVFPKGAAKIEHVAVSACFCAGEKNFETLRAAFPNLKSAFAYNHFSPKAESGAPADLKKWESMTDGDDPSQVDPTINKTATWNIADGTQGLPKLTVPEAEQKVKDMMWVLEEYRSGKRKKSQGGHDAQLNELYVRIADLDRHPDITAARKAEVDALRSEVFRWRHPDENLDL